MEGPGAAGVGAELSSAGLSSSAPAGLSTGPPDGQEEPQEVLLVPVNSLIEGRDITNQQRRFPTNSKPLLFRSSGLTCIEAHHSLDEEPLFIVFFKIKINGLKGCSLSYFRFIVHGKNLKCPSDSKMSIIHPKSKFCHYALFSLICKCFLMELQVECF